LIDFLIILACFYERKAAEILSLVLRTSVSDPDPGWIRVGSWQAHPKSEIGRNIMFEELVVGLKAFSYSLNVLCKGLRRPI
jgi:hypothetical protein